jgi:hypothetical protein
MHNSKFKVGDCVFCINNTPKTNDFLLFFKDLKLYKKYTIIDIDITLLQNSDEVYVTLDDIPDKGFLENRFISLKEYRKLKINKLPH